MNIKRETENTTGFEYPPLTKEELAEYTPFEQILISNFYDDQYTRTIQGILRDNRVQDGQPTYTLQDEIQEQIKVTKEEVKELALRFFGIQKEALYDGRTNLFNDKTFSSFAQLKINEMKKQKQGKEVSAMVFLDLDHLKRINDSMGHEAANALLEKIGEKLRAGLRPYDLSCRYGGDEFVLMLNSIAVEETEDRYQKVKQACARILGELGSLTVVENSSDTSEKKVLDVKLDQIKKDGDTEYVEVDGTKYNIKERASFSVGARTVEPGEIGESEESTFVTDRINEADAAGYFSKQDRGRNAITIINDVDEEGKLWGESIKFDEDTRTFQSGSDKSVEIKRLSEQEPTRDNIAKQVFEGLNRVMGCVTARNKNKIPPHIRESVLKVAEDVFEECYGSK